MHCTQCGHELEPNVKFCTQCGSPVPQQAPEPASTPQLQSPKRADTPQPATQVDSTGTPQPVARADSASTPRTATRLDPTSTPRPQRRFEDTSTAPMQQGAADTRAAAVRTIAPAASKGSSAAKYLAAIAATLLLVTLGFGATRMFLSLSAASDSSSAPSSEQADGSAPSSEQADDTVPASSLEEYSWERLSEISAEIAATDSDQAALDVAKQYSLCNDDGTLDGTQVKTVELANGTKAHAMIIGFRHDDKTGGGKAGITFLLKDAVTEKAMNPQHSNKGGWEATELRTWLNEGFLEQLPQELRDAIVPVDKRTNSAGKVRDISAVTAASNTVWLPSLVEVYGNIDWYGGVKDDGGTQDYSNVLAAEGSQYQLYRNSNVSTSHVSKSMECTFAPSTSAMGYDQGALCSWWLRSPDPYSSTRFFFIAASGGPAAIDWPEHTLPVAPAFCV